VNPELFLFYFFPILISAISLWMAHDLRRRYPQRYLSFHFYYLLFFQINNLVVRPVHALIMNMLGLDSSMLPTLNVLVLIFIAFPLFTLALYWLMRFAAALVDIALGSRFNRWFWLIQVGLYLLIITLFFGSWSLYHRPILPLVMDVLDVLSIFVLTSIHLWVIVKSSRIEAPRQRLGIRRFAIIYLVCFLLFNLFGFSLEMPRITFLLGFIYVLPPLFYLRHHHHQSLRQGAPIEAKATILQELFLRSSITEREEQVIERVVAGKSNAQIADELFISLPTVKNHMGSIFRKLEVGSRMQLAHLIRNSSTTRDNPS